MDRDEIIDSIREIMEDELGSDIEGVIETLVADEIETLQCDQRNWPAVTDCDRLRAAFCTLADAGFIARHHYSCCQSCGVFEIGIELDDAALRCEQKRAYVFYHVQDTESAVDGYGIMLAYGSASGEQQDCAAVGREIVVAIQEQGLDVQWSGDVAERIHVLMDWKHRWPPRKSDAISESVVERVLALRESQQPKAD